VLSERIFKLSLKSFNWNHQNALHLAASKGHLEVVKLLVEKGASVKVSISPTFYKQFFCTEVFCIAFLLCYVML